MKIIGLIQDLLESYENLNSTLLMRYVVGHNEMLVENMIIGTELYLGRLLFDACYKANAAKEDLAFALKELIISDKEVMCIQIGDMYFVPSFADGGSILFGKDLEMIKASLSAIKGVEYKLQRMSAIKN